MQTVRFTQLVKECGKPELKVLWGPPESDREFQRAITANRVLTIHQNNVGAKADYGSVGFSAEGPAQYLVFPKPLRSHQGKRVVGINYEVFEAPVQAMPKKAQREKPTKKTASAKTVEPSEAKETTPEPKRTVEESPSASAKSSESSDTTQTAADKSKKLKASHHRHSTVSKKARPEPKSGSDKTATTSPEAIQEKSKIAEIVPMELARMSQAKSAKTLKTKERNSRRSAAQGEEISSSVLKGVAQEVRKALKELEAGKAVAVYKRLEKVLALVES